MIAGQVVKGRTLVYVTMHEIGGATREEILEAAMAATRETPDSLFGSDIRYLPREEDSAVVSLYID